jgi:hypothetical protein
MRIRTEMAERAEQAQFGQVDLDHPRFAGEQH